MTRLLEKYEKEIVPKLQAEFGFSLAMQIPKLKKIVLNMGMGEAVQNQKTMEFAQYALTQIAGQKPVVTRSKKSIAGFKLREGLPIGCKVTLRGQRMYEFLDRLISVALPRVKDFRGISRKGFDGRGNYSMGLREQIVFPEINIDKLDKVRGLNITFTTTAATDGQGIALLEHFGMPFRKKKGEKGEGSRDS
ncbi:MAG: 50S ribosomal protein L5 [Bdellovibrionales bacterium]|nr:50S ribosomal protein L5 [Bdellovibrionales bacterium]